jgi:hypothetical protein
MNIQRKTISSCFTLMELRLYIFQDTRLQSTHDILTVYFENTVEIIFAVKVSYQVILS